MSNMQWSNIPRPYPMPRMNQPVPLMNISHPAYMPPVPRFGGEPPYGIARRPYFPQHPFESVSHGKRPRMDPPVTAIYNPQQGFVRDGESMLDRNISHHAAMQLALNLQQRLSQQNGGPESAVSPPRMSPSSPVEAQSTKNQEALDKALTENVELKVQNDDLQKRNAQLAARIVELESDLKSQRKQLDQSCDTFTKRLEDMEAVLSEKDDKINGLTQEKERLEANLRPGTASPSNGIEQVCLQTSENPQRINRQRLDILEEEVGTARKELENLQAEKRTLQQENAQLHQQYVNVQKERDRLNDQCQKLGQSVDANAQVDAKLKAAEEVNKKLEEDLEIERKGTKKFEQSLNVLKKQYGLVKDKLVATEKDLKGTKEKLSTATSGNELLGKDFKKFQHLKGKLPLLNQGLAELKSTLAALNTDVAKLKSGIVEETNQFGNAILEKSTAYLNDKMSCLRAEIEKKTSDLESAGQKLDESYIVQNTQQQKLEKQQARIFELDTALSAKEKALKAANDAKKAAKDDATKKIQAVVDEAKKIQVSMRAKLDESMKSQASLQAKLDESVGRQSSLQIQVDKLKEKGDQLVKVLDEKESALEAAKVSLRQIEAELSQSKNTFQTAKVEPTENEQIRKLRESMEEYKRKFDVASMDLERLTKNMQESESQKAELKKSVRAQRALVDKEKKERADATLRAVSMEEMKRRCEDEVAQLRTEKDKVQAELDRAMTDKQLHINLYADALGAASSLKEKIEVFASHEDPVVQEEKKKALRKYQSELMTALASAHNAGVGQDKKK